MVLVGFELEQLRLRWQKARLEAVPTPPSATPTDRWVFFDPGGLEGAGCWRILKPQVQATAPG